MKITFGKHKGKELAELPEEYLRWLTDSKVPGGYFLVPIEIKIEALQILNTWDNTEGGDS